MQEEDLLGTKEERQKNVLFVQALDHGIITDKEFAELTEGELLHIIYSQMGEPAEHVNQQVDMSSKAEKRVKYKVDMSRWKVDTLTLSIISENPRRSITELSSIRGVSRQTMTKYIKKFQEKGLTVSKKIEKERLIEITESGEKYLAKYGG